MGTGERTVPLVEDALALLPHLTGDELRRVAEAMPRVAGEWDEDTARFYLRPADSTSSLTAAFVGVRLPGVYAWTKIAGDSLPVVTTHPTARAAQAACDARLEAAGVRLCGEVVRDG